MSQNSERSSLCHEILRLGISGSYGRWQLKLPSKVCVVPSLKWGRIASDLLDLGNARCQKLLSQLSGTEESTWGMSLCFEYMNKAVKQFPNWQWWPAGLSWRFKLESLQFLGRGLADNVYDSSHMHVSILRLALYWIPGPLCLHVSLTPDFTF